MALSRMEDVALKAGVSVTTVSHVINATRPVAEATRRRVLEAMKILEYHTNVHARRLVRGKSDFFGLIISDIENPFFPELIKNFEIAASEQGFDTLLCTTNYDPIQTRAAFRRMLENKVSGVAVMTSYLDLTLAEELQAQRVPMVFLDSKPPKSLRSNIRVDVCIGVSQAVHYLHNLGHRDFAIIVGPQNRPSAAAYRNAVVEAIDHVGAARRIIIEGNNQVDGAVAAIRMLLTRPGLPTAILAGNDLAAIGAMSALQEAGIRVPEDVSVVGADDISFARLANPALTTVKVPRDQLGRFAFQALSRMLLPNQQNGDEIVVETELTIRKSTGLSRRGALEATDVQVRPEPD